MLADKIILERKKKGWSQEELAERLNVSRQSVSKWEGDLSVPELDKIVAMSELFGVSIDYLLKDAPRDADEEAEESPKRVVSASEAEDYIALSRRLSTRIALGVALCILSPTALIQLAAFANVGWITEGESVGVGLAFLFAFVGAALALFIPSGMRMEAYAFMEKEAFLLDKRAADATREEMDAFARSRRVLMTIGILLTVLSPVPLIAVACMWENWEMGILSCVNLLLLIVAVGVFLLVRAGYVNGAMRRLTQTGEFAPDERERTTVRDLVMTVYWGAATALYLTISLLTEAWHLTWIVWVVAGVLSPVVETLLKNRRIKKKN